MLLDYIIKNYPIWLKNLFKYTKFDKVLFVIVCRWDRNKSPLFDKEQIDWLFKHAITKDYKIEEVI